MDAKRLKTEDQNFAFNNLEIKSTISNKFGKGDICVRKYKFQDNLVPS